jgi:hypothetical protein
MNLNLPATKSTPSVVYNSEKRIVEFAGQSYPEDSLPFYSAIIEKLEAHLSEDHGPLTVNFKLDYFNTSSSKRLLDLLQCLETHHLKHNNIKVNWFFNDGDEDMQESGEDFQLDVKIPFNLIALEG